GHELVVLAANLVEPAPVFFGPRHQVAPWIHCAWPTPLSPHAPHNEVFSPIASIWKRLLAGAAGLGVPPVMSVGDVSSKCTRPTLVVENSATEENPLTKLAISITPTVPGVSTVELRISISNLGPTLRLSTVACGAAATITAVLPALLAASALNRSSRSWYIAVTPPPAVGVIVSEPTNSPGGLLASPGSALSICASNAKPVASPSDWRTTASIFVCRAISSV